MTSTRFLTLMLLAVNVVAPLLHGEVARQSVSDYLLLPRPQIVQYTDGSWGWGRSGGVRLHLPVVDGMEGMRQLLAESVRRPCVERDALSEVDRAARLSDLTVLIDPASVAKPQGYRLEIGVREVRIVGHDRAGVYYAIQTFRQIVKQAAVEGAVRCLVIEDWPDFPNRGVLLDISRDKVPSLESLFALVDRLASFKVNQFQLYTEHTFAYRNHPDVWEHASPMTPAQIRELDAYCRERFVELVPNQNSFGHMEHWFKHERYRPLAEQLGVRTPAGDYEGWALCPTDPASIAFLAGLYDELLPNFSSTQFNVGCDEVYGLGEGRSKAVAAERGKPGVYLDFVRQIRREAAARGCTIQIWADFLGKHPELLAELPKDVTALVWGYRANTPFAERCAAMAAAGLKFYVCPGTSTWQTIAGRLQKAKANLLNAATNGRRHGAIGFLNTNWGDFGHWETPPFSWPGFAYGAALSWAVEANRSLDLPAVLDAFVFDDLAGIAGRVVCDLGLLQIPHAESDQRALLQDLLRQPDADWSRHALLQQLTPDNLRFTRQALNEIQARFTGARMQCADAAIVKAEVMHAIALLLFSAELAGGKLSAPEQKLANLPPGTRQELAAKMEELMAKFQEIWLLRNRPGGWEDSVKPLKRIVRVLRGDTESTPPAIGEPPQ